MARILNLVQPGHPRYQPRGLEKYFGYDHWATHLVEVELAVMDTLGEVGVIPKREMRCLSSRARQRALAITTTQIDRRERKVTKHDIRALVQLIQRRLPKPLRRWVHVPLTSYDVVESARARQYLVAHQQVVRPALAKVIKTLAKLVRKYARIVQVGRTHGQHALPITVGFWLATILSRFVDCAQELDRCAAMLVGKVSGAVGAKNALVGLGIEERAGEVPFDVRVLRRLGLKPAAIATQIVPPEPLTRYLTACVHLTGVFAQFADDCRHLMRSEIGEVMEAFTLGQVGSSTMAQKRNPITFENLKAMFIIAKNVLGMVHDTLVSEHQRDLTGSAVARYFPIIVISLTQSLDNLLRADKSGKSFLERMTIDKKACLRNLERSAGTVTAEPLYLAMQMAGYRGDGHKLVNERAMPLVKSGECVTLAHAVARLGEKDAKVRQAWKRIPENIRELLFNPASYTGSAVSQSRAVARRALRYAG